jgi:ABC-2 type transport system ATP-binding protein
VLDEPTSGLDPTQITEFRKLLDELRGEHTIILSTHNLGEIVRVADRALIIDQGSIRYDAPVARESRLVLEVKAAPEAVQRIIAGIGGVAGVEVAAHDGWARALVKPEPGKDVREAIGQLALANHWAIRQLGYEASDLERRFAEVTAGAPAAGVAAAAA